MKPNRIQISAQIESGLRGSFVMLRRASSIEFNVRVHVNIVYYGVEASSKSRLRWSRALSRAIEVSLGFRSGRDIRPWQKLCSQPYWAFRRFRFLARGFDARGEVGGKFSNGWFLKDNWKGLNRFSDWEFNLPRGTGNISRVIDIFCKEKSWSRIFNISFFSCFVYNPIISNILWYVK